MERDEDDSARLVQTHSRTCRRRSTTDKRYVHLLARAIRDRSRTDLRKRIFQPRNADAGINRQQLWYAPLRMEIKYLERVLCVNEELIGNQ